MMQLQQYRESLEIILAEHAPDERDVLLAFPDEDLVRVVGGDAASRSSPSPEGVRDFLPPEAMTAIAGAVAAPIGIVVARVLARWLGVSSDAAEHADKAATVPAASAIELTESVRRQLADTGLEAALAARLASSIVLEVLKARGRQG